jgi:CheY-specific phosphatase CheX
MSVKKEPKYKKYLVYIKDVVYIVGLVIALGGWISTKSKNEAVLETTVKYNTETIKKLESFMSKQSELNGKMIQFMASSI